MNKRSVECGCCEVDMGHGREVIQFMDKLFCDKECCADYVLDNMIKEVSVDFSEYKVAECVNCKEPMFEGDSCYEYKGMLMCEANCIHEYFEDRCTYVNKLVKGVNI